MTNWLAAPAHANCANVGGRATGYSAGKNEIAWKAAVAQAFRGITLDAPCRIGIEIHFRLQPTQVRHLAPDLDNLIKSTIDALVDVIGERDFRGRRQADDERVDFILARKDPVSDANQAGASIAVWALDRLAS